MRQTSLIRTAHQRTEPTPLADSLPKTSSSEAARAAAREAEAERQRERDRQARISRLVSLWNAAGVPKRHALGLDLRTTATGPWAELYIKLADRLDKGFLVALLGKRGTGKTQLAACLIRAACERLLEARYVKALDLFREVRASFRDGGPDEREVIKRFASYSLLVIDEAHERGNTEFEDRTLVNIIDHRYDAMRATILIANETKEAFAASVGLSIVSRIQETGEAVVCEWESFRKQGGSQ